MPEGGAPSWRKAFVGPGANLREAIEVLNAAALRIALVVDGDDTLLGTITDGDIRRGLLRGLQLESPIDEVIHREAFVVPPGLDRSAVGELMRANNLLQLPVVDASRRLVGLHLWDEIFATEDRQNVFVVMAGGQGSRLRPYTEHCPKPLLPVAGKPMIEHILERARRDGFRRFMLAINYLGHMVEEHFADGAHWGVEIGYLKEQSPLGTAGALSLLEQHPQESFIVTNGDVLTDINYGSLLDYHVRHAASATMAVRPHEWQHPFGVVHTDGIDIQGFDEKPVAVSHVNAGIYVLEPCALDHLEVGETCDMPSLFERLRSAGLRTIVYPMHEPWLDVGRPDDYAKAGQLTAGKE